MNNMLLKFIIDYKYATHLLWTFWKEPESIKAKVKLLYTWYFGVHIIFYY